MGPADSSRLSRVRPYSGAGRRPPSDAYGAFTLYGRTFQNASAGKRLSNSHVAVLQPPPDESGGFRLIRVRSPLLTESLLLSFPRGTEMFQFPRWALHTYGFSVQLFRDLGLNARLTAPPRLSQSSTPFIASWRPDIPHTPLVAWPHWPRPPTRSLTLAARLTQPAKTT